MAVGKLTNIGNGVTTDSEQPKCLGHKIFAIAIFQ